LAIDSQRTSFAVVGREEKLVRTIAGIELKTFADRIDRLDDGRLVIVDYKTGEPSVADWFTERIAEPQLPLYSVVVEGEVAGVVFAQIKKGSVKYLGVVADANIIPNAKEPEAKRSVMEHFKSLDEVIHLWKGKIEFLADEVRQGIAVVAPVSIHTSCQYCDLGPMCRIGEIDFLKP
jgi:ATP-dependent helicase/nuclease subunit B